MPDSAKSRAATLLLVLTAFVAACSKTDQGAAGKKAAESAGGIASVLPHDTAFAVGVSFAKLKSTKVLYVQSKTDKLFDIALCPAYVSDMRKAGIDITYVELPSNKGHMASHADAALWAPMLGAFMKSL